VLDLIIAGAHGLGLTELDRRELDRLGAERSNVTSVALSA
jgi:hypothetical protein